jgi:hypothetical protein
MAPQNPSTLWIATRKGLFAAQRGPRGWQLGEPAFLGDPVTMVLPDARDGRIYAALRLGHFGVKLHRSDDRGKTWQEIAAPAYPPKPEPAPGAEPDKTPWSTDLVWSLAAGAPSQPGRLWAGTIPGGLFRSDDGGDHWSLVESLWQRPERAQWFGGGYDHAGIHSICLDPRDARRLTIAVSCGGVWHSDDEGASWTLLGRGLVADYMPAESRDDLVTQDPHLMVRCAGAPDTLWIQHHNGVFVSRDAGRQWQAVKGIQPSDFGFAVAVHPRDPQTAWFAPAIKDERRVPVDARLVVTRTRDGGGSFQALSQGLPQPSWDLVYRHGLVVDDSGSLLAMASTTGGLWVSQDGGERWETVSAHLPPVYALRFGN